MDYHRLQSEKAQAMMRFRRLRNIAKMWRLLKLLVALVVLSWSWSSTLLPLSLKLVGQFVLQLYPYIFDPFFNFVIGNAIIIVIVLISRKNDGGNEISDHYVENSDALHRIDAVSDELTTIPEASLAAEPEETEDKHIVISENAVTEIQCDAVRTAIEQATKQIERFKRTQSEKLKSDLQATLRRQLRRSETVALSGNDRAISSFDTVDTLSNEEFRSKIETFIAEQQRLWSQKNG